VKKILFVLLSIMLITLIILMVNGCASSNANEKKISDEIWDSEKFLEQYPNFENNLMAYLNFNNAIGGFQHDDENAEKLINDYIKSAGFPATLYALHKTYQLETELGTVFETEPIGEGGYEKVLFPKSLVKDVILQLFSIDENNINWQDFKINGCEADENNYGMIMIYGGGYFDAEILYDTMVYSTGTNTVTFNIKFWEEAGSDPPHKFELCTIKYQFQPFMYKDKIQQYKFISAERIS